MATANRWLVWLAAARPATLPAAVTPVLVGGAAALGGGAFRPGVWVVTLVAALLIQIATNLANDADDFRRGADTGERLGPLRVTQAGLLSATAVTRAAVAVFGAAAGLGLYLIAVGGWPILVVGVLSILAAVTYTGGPWPFGYHGLGEVFVFIFFGLVAVLGTYYLQTATVDWLAVAAALPVACTATAILVVNNLRDRASDQAAGKHTLAVILGEGPTRVEYGVLVLAPFVVIAAAVASGLLPAAALIAVAALPLAVYLVHQVGQGISGRDLNPVLKRTAMLHLLVGLLLALGLGL